MASFTFSFTIVEYVGPFLSDVSPEPNETGVDGYVNPVINILDDYSGVNPNSVQIQIDSSLAFQGPSTFFSPWNGTNSSIITTTIDGYDGYQITFDGTTLLPPSTQHLVDVVAQDNYGNNINDNVVNPIPSSYTFRTGFGFTLSIGDFENKLDLLFSDTMPFNINLLTAANYEFSNGMYSRTVEFVDSRNISLYVEKFYDNQTFTFSIKNIVDGYSDTIPSSYNSQTISPFQSTADITNYNGLVKTWHDSSLVQADSQRIYLSSIRGIDVFRIINQANIAKWAQVYDAYGVQAMFVANFGSDLTITDTTAPFLTSQTPPPNGVLGVSDFISFTITDATTAPNIEQTIVYINSTLAFSGGFGGWFNNFLGLIFVSHKQLAFFIKPTSPFSVGETVIIRVISQDLLGNDLDTSYSVTVGIPALSGFGLGSWGFSTWGGGA